MENEELTQDQLTIAELQSRIGQLVSQYETALASLRAQATMEINRLNAAVETLSAKVLQLEGSATDAVPSE